MLATRASIHASPEEARATVETALALLAELGGEGGYGEAQALFVAAEVLLACGERTRAREIAAMGRRRLLARADAFAEPERERFLTEVPLQRRILVQASDPIG
jgi:hypothetical protein